MTIALTGATGFVGGHVLRRLREAGHDVRALTRRPQPPGDGVDWVEGALDDEAALARLCEGAETVVHVAGVVNARDAAGFDAGNRRGTLAVLHAAESAGVQRFVHVSSLTAREPGLSVYGASKRAAEDAVALSALDWRIVRPPAVYGPGDMEMLDLFRMAKRGLVLLPPAGRISLIHADDLARLIVALTGEAGAHAIVEADDGREGGWTHAAFAAALGDAVGGKAIGLHTPRPLLRLASALERLVRPATAKLTADRISYLCHADWTIDPAVAPPPDLWTPAIPTPRGLAETASWYRAEGLL